MATKKVILIVGIVVTCFASVACADHGTATFYTPPYVPSSCYGYQNRGVMIAAASHAIWDNRGACGRRYRIKCVGGTNLTPHPCKSGSVVVTIVDYCPPGSCHGTIDLSQEAYSKIANPDAGKVRIAYNRI